MLLKSYYNFSIGYVSDSHQILVSFPLKRLFLKLRHDFIRKSILMNTRIENM